MTARAVLSSCLYRRDVFTFLRRSRSPAGFLTLVDYFLQFWYVCPFLIAILLTYMEVFRSEERQEFIAQRMARKVGKAIGDVGQAIGNVGEAVARALTPRGGAPAAEFVGVASMGSVAAPAAPVAEFVAVVPSAAVPVAPAVSTEGGGVFGGVFGGGAPAQPQANQPDVTA